MNKIIGGFVLAFFVVFGILFGIDAAHCDAKWEDSGYPSKYGVLSGCRIYKDSRWIPSSAIREFE